MKQARRFLLPLFGTVVGLLLVFVIINEIDAPLRVELPDGAFPIGEKGRMAFIDFMGIAAPLDTDWKAAGQKAFAEMDHGHPPDRIPLVKLENVLSGKVGNKMPTGTYHDGKFVETNRTEISAYLKATAPYLERFKEILADGDMGNPLKPAVSNNFPSIVLLKFTKAQHTNWDALLQKGDSTTVIQQAKDEWNFAKASLAHPMPLIQVMINLNIMNSTKQYLIDAAADRSAFKTSLEKSKPSEFVATLDMDKLCDQARIWEQIWVKDLLEVPYQKGSFDSPIAAHFRHRNINRIRNGINDAWLAGENQSEYETPASLFLYPFASGTIKVLASNIGHTRHKMEEHKVKLASPLS